MQRAITRGMISVDKRVLNVALACLQCKETIQVFIPEVGNMMEFAIENQHKRKCYISGLISSEIKSKVIDGIYSNSILYTKNPSIYTMEDKFEMSMCIPTFDYDIDSKSLVPCIVKDELSIFKCSKFTDDRLVAMHQIQFEQSVNSIMVGCFLISVLPARWYMNARYMKWCNTNIATVAKIKLSKDLYCFSSESKDPMYDKIIKDNICDDMNLCIYFKPSQVDNDIAAANSMRYEKVLQYAEMTWTPYISEFDGTDKSADNIVDAFQNTDWYKMSVFQWIKLKEERGFSPFKRSYGPHGLKNKESMIIVRPSKDNELKLNVIKNDENIAKTRNKIRIQTSGSKVRLKPENLVQRALIHEFMISDGFIDATPRMSVKLKRSFHEIKNEMLEKLNECNIIPCTTESDQESLKAKARWLNRNLAPIPRNISISKHDSRSKMSVIDSQDWYRLYEDIGIKATSSSIYYQWYDRAYKIGLNHYLKEFQLENVIFQCMKDGVVNSDAPGLGKTRQMLFTAILKGAKKMLIVCPTKLIGTWQDEIDNVLIPFSIRYKKHWSGRYINIASAHVIETAEDCKNKNLAMFNIIGYDKLKSIPRDGYFYKCPKCGFVVYSVKKKHFRCPGDPYYANPDPDKDLSCVGEYRRYKASVKERDANDKLIHQKYKVHKDTGLRVHWDESNEYRVKHGIKDSDCIVIDNRSDSKFVNEFGEVPMPPFMEIQESMFDKMTTCETGFEARTDASGVSIKVPVVSRKKRKYHVKWTFAELLRNKFPIIVLDESMYIANPGSKRARAVDHLCSRCRYSATGTPMKGLPQTILFYFNWTAPKETFPDYRRDDPEALQRFLKRYKTDVYIKNQSGLTKAKQIHKIKNAEAFQAEVSPLLIRHVRTDPDVTKDIPPNKVLFQDIFVKMDDQHREYYALWLKLFREWWSKMKEEEEGWEGKKVKDNLLAKMIYLIGASTNPHSVLNRILDNIKKGKQVKDEVIREWLKIIKPYKGPPVAKMIKTFDIIKEAVARKEKTIVYANRTATLDMGKIICDKFKIPSVIVDGRVPLTTAKGQKRSRRHLLVQDFRFQNIPVMWAGITALAEGMNIPEANHGAVFDTTWEPKDIHQAIGRMARPQQRKTIFANMLIHEGTIEEYLFATNYLKLRSHTEGIDGIAFSDISSEMIPDIVQYANAIVDGTEEVMKRQMWTMVEKVKHDFEVGLEKKMTEEGDDDEEESIDDEEE